MMRPLGVTVALAILALASACGDLGDPPNVLLVTFDTTRWDHMGYASGQEGVTPMLDALAARGTWFSTCVTTQPLTLPAHTSILSGQYPHHHGVRNNGTYIVPDATVTLAERFAEAGYATHAVVSAFVLDSRFGLDQGFDSYDDDLSGGPKQKMFMFKEVKAEQTAARALAWLREERPAEKPFFLWVHFFDPHADYEPPGEWAARFPGDPYTGEIAYADNSLGYVLKYLDDQQLLERTVIAFTSDHGDGLGEHGESTHGLFIYDSTTRVPLLLSGPGVPAGRRVDDLVRVTDIAPTLLELAGLEGLEDADGASLVPVLKGRGEPRTAYLETFVPRQNFGWAELRGMRDADAKVIQAPRSEAYDLDSDPEEARNLMAGRGTLPDSARELLDQLGDIVEADPYSHGEQQESEVDQETRRRLAQLGYVWAAPVRAEGELPDPKDRLEYWERFQAAQNLIRQQRYEEARTAVEALLEDDPRNVVAMGSLATVLMHGEEYARALEVYRTMIQLDPQRDTAYLGSARALVEMGRWQEAEAQVNRLLERQPESVEAYTALGDFALDRGEFELAEKRFRRALEIDPHSSLAASGLGNCLNRAGRLEDARDLLARHHRMDPTSHAVTYNLAVVSERLGDRRAAVALYQQAVKLDPEHSMTWNNLGSILSKLDRQQDALRCVAKAHQLDPDNVEATYNLGALLARAGRPEQALPLIEEALVRQPDLQEAVVLRGRVLERLGRREDALEHWRWAAQHSPGALLQVARLELAMGDRAAARSALDRAIAADGDRARQAAARHPQLRELLR